MKSFKYKYYHFLQERRYKKFRKCSLPYPFWDKRRDTFEWVYYDEHSNPPGYDVQNSLYDILGSGVTYHYEAFMNGRQSPEQEECKYEMIESHCHSFEEVVKCVYDYPESFRIPKDCLQEYSEQELRCLKKMQSYLKAIGMKDRKESPELQALDEKWEKITNKKKKNLKDYFFLFRYSKRWEKLLEKEKLNRYQNEKALLYSSYHELNAGKRKIAEAYVNGQKNYILSRKYSFNKKSEVGYRSGYQ